MAVLTFIKFDGGKPEIKGESDDKDHKDETEVLSWGIGASRAGAFHSGTGGSVGGADLHDIDVTIEMQKSATALFEACASGAHLPKVVITQYRQTGPDAEREKYMVVAVGPAVVTNVNTSVSTDGGVPLVTFTINYKEIKYEYMKLNEKGTKVGGGEFTWNVSKNTKTLEKLSP
jgi:type VI secretion system secreted protein Hcp